MIEKTIKIEKDFIIKSGGKFYPIICVNLLEPNDSNCDLFSIYFGKSNTVQNDDFYEYLLDIKSKLSFLETIKINQENSSDLQVKIELLKLVNSLLKSREGD